MKRGWGYNANRKGEKEKAVDGLFKKFENDKMKVYESLDNSFYGNKLSIRILFNKEKGTIKAILTGKDMTGERIKPIEKDISNLKTLSKIKEYLSNNLINEFNELAIGIYKKEIEEMSDEQFQRELNKFINEDIKIMSKEKASNMWARFYNDMFERSYLYDNFEITLTHNKYLKAVNQI